MATSGTIGNTFRTGYRVQIKWTVTGQSVANNTSTVKVEVQLVSLGSSYTINSSATKNGSVKINGTTYNFTFNATLTGNQTKTINTQTVTVAHNADGSKTCSFSCSAGINVTLSGTYYGNVTASGSGVFNTIARATQPSLSATSINMGAAVTISTPRASDSFTHKLSYTFGNQSGTIATAAATSHSWTLPLGLASAVPNATSGTGTIKCETYNGSTLIGSKSVSFTAKVPASVVPTFGSVAVADSNATYAAKFGSLVQNKSRAKFTITASGAYGSTITAYKTVIEGKTYTGASPTTAVLTGSGNVTAKITITDSRGRTATFDKTFYRIPYTSPKITALEAFRSDAAGNVNYEGLNATVAAAFTIAAASDKNTSSYKIEYKAKTATTWTQLAAGSGYTYDKSITSGAVFGIDSSFEVRLTVTDYFGSVVKTVELPTAFTLLDFNASGRGIAFGKVSEKADGIEFGMDTYFSHAEVPSSAIQLQTGQNLNDILDAGFYSIPTTAISASLLNKPWTTNATGSLTVIQEGNSGQRLQIMHKGTKGDGAIYERAYYGGAWGAWSKVYGGEGKILWTGGMYMTAGHIITFAEPASMQNAGIVLVFSEYVNGEVMNQTFFSFFIHKQQLALHSGSGYCFYMGTSNGAFMASKYLYIRNDGITGHANNGSTFTNTAAGLTLTNTRFVLRYVIGV